MDENRHYFTPSAPARTEFTIKKSRFIADLRPAADKETVESALAAVREEFADARHHCYAWRLSSGAYRADDAGEPAGSAGKPILQALETRTVCDAVLVVTRYFGGIKLGIGGLIRAYGQAAFQVLDAAQLREVSPVMTLEISFSYDTTGTVRQILTRFDAAILDTGFSDRTSLRIRVAAAQADALRQQLIDATRGEIDFR